MQLGYGARSLAILDSLALGSSLSLRAFARLGNGVAILDVLQLGSTLALRSFARTGSSLSVLDMLHLGSAISLRAFLLPSLEMLLQMPKGAKSALRLVLANGHELVVAAGEWRGVARVVLSPYRIQSVGVRCTVRNSAEVQQSAARPTGSQKPTRK